MYPARSDLLIAAGMDHLVTGPPTPCGDRELPDSARVSFTAELQPGERYGWTSWWPTDGLEPHGTGALRSGRRCPRGARQIGWGGLLYDQRRYLDDFWARADVEVNGDPEIQQAVRFSLFHVLQAGARAERRAIPAKGLTGPATTATLLGHGDVCAAGPDVDRPVPPRRTRCAGAIRPSRWPRHARSSSGWPVPPSRGAPSTARNVPAIGRRERMRFTSTPTSPTPSSAT